jgi:hypothetical protein
MPRAVVIELVDVVVSSDEVDVLLFVEVARVAIKPKSTLCVDDRRSACELGEIVVMPCGVVIELEDVDIVTDGRMEVDMLLVIEQGYVSIYRLYTHDRWSAGELSEIIEMPCVVVIELVDMPRVSSNEDDVLLVADFSRVYEDAFIASECPGDGEWSIGDFSEIVVMPRAVVIELVNM